MSEEICFITDSSGRLPREVVEQHQVKEVPFYLKFQDTDYCCENVDYSAREFYEHTEKNPEDVPQTAVPSVNDWLVTLEERYIRGAKDFIVTTISSKLSSSFRATSLAKNVLIEQHGDVQIKVIDSNTYTCGQASLEIAIAKVIESGKGFREIISRVNQAVGSITTLFVVNSLKYMEAGRRIGGATAFLEKLAQVKPICEFIDDAVHPVETVIGRENSLKTMMDAAISRISDWGQLIVTVQDVEFSEDAGYTIDYLRKAVSFSRQIYRSDLGIVVGTHFDPGAAGIGLVEAGPLLG